jgi:hypothetical protein
MITTLRHWFTVMVNKDRGITEAKSEHLSARVKNRATEGLDLLEIVTERYRTLREALAESEKRRKRCLVDARETVLQWLFGVATGLDLKGLKG